MIFVGFSDNSRTMKFFRIFLMVSLPFFAFSVKAQLSISSKVSNVTIYSNQALVERTANVSLKKGENQLIFYNLENGIQANSIKMMLSEQVTVVNSFFNMQHIPNHLQSQTIQNILTESAKKEKEAYFSNQKVRNLQEEKNIILHNKNASGEDGFDVKRMESLTAYYRKSLNELDHLIYEEQQIHKKIQEDINEYKKQLQALGFRAQGQALNATVIATNDLNIPVKISYVVHNVGWTPFYDIKSDGVNPEIKASYKANIYQNTGVNWDGIPVSLSTSQPLLNQSIPTLHPWVLRFYEPELRMQKNAAISNRAYRLEQGADADDVGEYKKEIATAVENMTSKEFQINIPLTISGSNGKAVLHIEEYTLNGAYQYFAIPKYNNHVYLTAYLTDWEKFDLLPGVANLYLGKDFVGTTFVNTSQYGDSLQLPFGKDDGIVIKRERIQDVSKSSVLGRFTHVEMGVRVIVKNNKKTSVSLVLKDQIPVSSTDEIEVTMEEISKAKHLPTTGELEWIEALKPGETKTYVIRYQVKYPRGRKLANF